MTASMMEPSLVELIGSNLIESVLILSCTSAKVATVALVDGVASTTRSPLLSQFSLCNCFRYRVVVSMASTITLAGEHYIVASCIEKLRCHHHLLLLTRVRIGRLTLVDQIEQVRLVSCCVLMTDATRSADSVMAYTRSSCAECT